MSRAVGISPNKSTAKALIAYLVQWPQVEVRCNVTSGYDITPYTNMIDFKIWEEVKPPLGTVYNYPILS